MVEPYLILHRVRGEPAFDIATKIDCPHCQGYEGGPLGHCEMCDDEGTFWIIPTSGHRAHPYWTMELNDLGYDLSYPGEPEFKRIGNDIPPMPPGWPDHYPSRAAPSIDIRSVLTALTKSSEPVERRF